MKNENPMDLVEQFMNDETRSTRLQPDEECRVVRESEVNRLVQEGREARDAREYARDQKLGVRRPATFVEIADDLKRRSDYLRSRPLRGRTKQWELEILAELDELEAYARASALQEATGALSTGQLAKELELVTLGAFAVRGRYHDLLDAQGEDFPSRTSPSDPAARAKELALIEAFLERKKRGGTTPGGEGGGR